MVILILAGLVAGFIDSIAGGGGLVTLPALSIVLGPGVGAIATNKVAATASSAIALFVYVKNGHVALKGNLIFAVTVGLAAWIGSRVAPFFGPEFFKWLLIVICPLILWIVWNKDLWIRTHPPESLKPQTLRLLAAGFACGFYDGIAGPGGGTLMFLSLLFFGRLPLVTALGTAKLANLSSASVSLTSYVQQGLVHWNTGLILASSITIGAFFGAELASVKAAHAARIALLVVVTLLMARLLLS